MAIFRLSILVVLIGLATTAYAKGGYIYEYAGDVQVAVAGGLSREAADRLLLDDNTTVTTGNGSRAVLKFEDGQIVVLKPNTSFLINKYSFNPSREENNTISFSLLKGGIRSITGEIGARNKQAFKLSTPNATCRIRGTDFMLQTEGDALYGQVTSGALTLQNDSGIGLFTAGQSMLVASRTAKPVASTVPPLTFIPLQLISAPPATPAPVPALAVQMPMPTAKDLSAMAAHVVGATPSDIALAMIQDGYSPVTVTAGIVEFDPRAAASVTAATIAAAPTRSVEIVTIAVTAAPNKAAAIATAAAKALPAQAVAITMAAVRAAPASASEISSAVITAVPDHAAEIVDAVGSTIPNQQAESAPAVGKSPVPPASQETQTPPESVVEPVAIPAVEPPPSPEVAPAPAGNEVAAPSWN